MKGISCSLTRNKTVTSPDCVSTQRLRDWLEQRRQELIDAGAVITRPLAKEPSNNRELSEHEIKVAALVEKLTAGIPADVEERSNEQQATWLLAQLLEWHRREAKAGWWEFFRLNEMPEDELLAEKAAIGGMTLIGQSGKSKKGLPIHHYSFPAQDTDLRQGDKLKIPGEQTGLGEIKEIDKSKGEIKIQKTGKSKDLHPSACFTFENINQNVLEHALFRMGEYVAENGIEGAGPYAPGRHVLLNLLPSVHIQDILHSQQPTLKRGKDIMRQMEEGMLPIQGPPGTGKSYTGARMICEAVQQGKKIGITANSHKVIRNLIDKVIEASYEVGVDLSCVQKPKEAEEDQARLSIVMKNPDLLAKISSGECQVAGATPYLWASEPAADVLDVLFIDEAGQMSLANVLAASQCAKSIVLLGDPQQLDQPTQGTHPDGAGVSALDHILQGRQTIAAEQGLFLGTTYRMHPEICLFNSEMFYDGKLAANENCAGQRIISDGPVSGSGLLHFEVEHSGNSNSSPEEAKFIADLVDQILAKQTSWVDRNGVERPIELADILIITPYNAQVMEIEAHLPGANVGTVDKFQGQEAPIAIYSMAASSNRDAPRGMEFLYSANRLNVAISRAQCLAILVSSPVILEPECQSPKQMKLANAFCRFTEFARDLKFA